MGFANRHLEKLRKIGRKCVLPVDEIKGILEARLDFATIKSVADFGAGTLFWSEWFADKLAAFSQGTQIFMGDESAKFSLNANERERERERNSAA